MPPMTKKAKAEQETAAEERKVLYPEYEARIYHEKDGNPMSDEEVTKLLGWKVEANGVKFGDEFLVEVPGIGKVRCDNNYVPGRYSNRPVYWDSLVVPYAQDMLNKNWKFNMEPWIIGKTGCVLDGQNSMLALKYANILRNGKDKEHWDAVWGEGVPVTINKLVCFGCDEADDVINSMNTGKPRSLADVMYRSPHFASMKAGERKVAGRMAEHAIKLLWHRTGEKVDAFSPRMTQTEATEFMTRHERLVRCIKHIMTEDPDKKGLKHYITPGYASAMMYLMASCNSDPEKYRAAEGGGTDKELKWDNWSKAVSFWNGLIAGKFKAVREYLAELGGESGDEGVTRVEKLAVIVKAWNAFSNSTSDDPIRAAQSVTRRAIELDFDWYDESGATRKKVLPDFPGVKVRELAQNIPTVGGIDLGDPEKEAEKPEEVSNGSAEKPKPNGKPTPRSELTELKERHRGEYLIFQTLQDKVTDGKVTGREVVGYKVFDDDARVLAKILGMSTAKLGTYDGMRFLSFPPDKYEEYLGAVQKIAANEGWAVSLVTPSGDEADPYKVEPVEKKVRGRAATNGKPAAKGKAKEKAEAA